MTHAVQVDDMAPLHDARDARAGEYMADELALLAIHMSERAEAATKLSSALVRRAQSNKVQPIGVRELIDLHAEILTIKSMAAMVASQV